MLFQYCTELTTHFTRIARDLSDDLTLEFDVVSRLVDRNPHAASRTLCRDDPRETDIACVSGGHDLTAATLTDAPFG